ncbi:ABC transporter permease [Lederbergia wuyishanensis]|uniref:ABC-2 type transport system permease protein n=1 Tax=Lederbergia wuyishanensis TaxID=1347903 RepID=A0ABU0D4W0_9BACI|nr:ABC transporter permease [Lederbergia wuyishanensis]MCJ8009543.1 ABC transporter permease [Lederbergia wuyishanensis]MDQ0343448.1 ABC-2 type transport system permease protein [Lederbergia wuyishanensis]
MNSTQLLFKRIKQNWKQQFAVIKRVVDWTVLVYLVIPAVVISLSVYRSWWVQIPDWMTYLPFQGIFLLFFLFLWGEHFLTYVREADRIFLRKKEKLFLGMKRGGIIYSYIFQWLSAVTICILIAPLWFKYFDLRLGQLILFAGLWVSLKWMIMAVKGKLDVELRGWRSLLRGVPLFFGAAIIWIWCYKAFINDNILIIFIIIIINSVVSYILVQSRFRSVHTFDKDLAIDELERSKYLEVIFGISMDMEKMPKPVPVRRNPRLYSKSNRIFRNRTPKNGFIELFIKATTRNIEYIIGYFQIMGVTSAAMVILPPLWLKITMAVLGTIFLLIWLGSVWHKVIGSHSFTKKFATQEAYYEGKKVVSTILLIPFIILVGCSFMLNIWIRNHFFFF